MNSRIKFGCALSALVSLSSCGGGGGSDPSPPVVVTPTPTPLPTGTATATPPPLFTYTMASDFTRDQSYETFGAILRSSNSTQTGENQRLAVENYGPDNRLTLLYTANPARAVLRRGGATGAVLLDYSVLQQRSERAVTVAAADASLSGSLSLAQFGPTAGNFPVWLDYLVAFNGNGATGRSGPVVESALWSLIGGARTQGSDVPAAGVVRYAGRLSMLGFDSDARPLYSYLASSSFGNPGYFEVVIDFAARTLRAQIPAAAGIDQGGRTVNFALDGILSSSSRDWEGTVSSDIGTAGSFSGALFGPGGRELGLTVTFREGDIQFAGTLTAVRIAPAP